MRKIIATLLTFVSITVVFASVTTGVLRAQPDQKEKAFESARLYAIASHTFGTDEFLSNLTAAEKSTKSLVYSILLIDESSAVIALDNTRLSETPEAFISNCETLFSKIDNSIFYDTVLIRGFVALLGIIYLLITIVTFSYVRFLKRQATYMKGRDDGKRSLRESVPGTREKAGSARVN